MESRKITLHEMLMHRRVPELRKLVSNWMVKGTSKMRKYELVSTLEHELLRPGNLDEIFLMAGDIGWQLIQDAATVDNPFPVPANAVNYARMFADFGYLQYEGNKQAGTVNMPVEIKEALMLMKENGFHERKARVDLLFAYSQAAVTLYGVIEQTELVDIINRQVEPKTDLDELLQSQMRHLDINALYCYTDNYLVSIIFKENNYEDIPNLISAAVGKPRYIPPKETFLLYSDGCYYEKTVHIANFKTTLINSWNISEDKAEIIMAEVVFSLQIGANMSNVIQILLRHGLVIQDDMLPTITSIITAVHESTRLWKNKGYTPNEYAQMLSKLNGNKSRRTSGRIKINRNDMCPCGSGKKYKKCCGR